MSTSVAPETLSQPSPHAESPRIKSPRMQAPRIESPRHHFAGFLIIAFLFAVTMSAGAVPSPLYVLYQHDDGFNSFMITVIFAVYAVGVVISLFLAGHLSDRFGRRRVLFPAALLNVLAMLVFMSSHALILLLVARFISGLGIGILSATATAHMTELYQRSGRAGRGGELLATVVNMGGIGIGPFIGGVLAQYAPEPLFTPFMVIAVLLVVGLLGTTMVPETVNRADNPDSGWHYQPQRIVVPANARGAYFGAATVAFVGFAVSGFFTGLAPTFLAVDMHVTSHVIAGAAGLIFFGSSVIFQIVASFLRREVQYAVGLILLGVGIALMVLGIAGHETLVMLLGGFVAGGGSGMTFKAGIGTVVSVAPAASRGEALAGLFLFAYVGLAVPVVGLGALMLVVPMLASVMLFAAALLALLVVTCFVLASTGGFRKVSSAASPA